MKLVILQQAVNLSILTAVMLGLHGFVANLTAGGGFGVEVRDSTNELSNPTYGRSKLATGVSTGSSKPQDGSHVHSSIDGRSRVRRMGSSFKQHEEADEWDESDGRSRSSQENIIRQTVTWQVSRDGIASNSLSGSVDTTLPHGEPREASAMTFVV
jgi:hypothetical protein